MAAPIFADPLGPLSDPPPPILEARGLVRTYGAVRAVDGLDLTVRRGEIYGFLGRNGAGKTTTIRMLMGIIRADAGTIAIRGRVTARPTIEDKQLIGYVAQEQHFYPWMTCRALARFVAGFYPSWDDAELERLFRSFELPPERKVSELSGGMRVKLALALAIAPRPPILILDEPTAGLDPVARRELLELMHHHARAAGQTVFFSSHLIDEVEKVADRVGILDQGKLVYEGPISELRAWVRQVDLSRVPPDASLAQFRVLRAHPGVWAILIGRPESWAAEPGLDAASQAISLDDIFIALVGRLPNVGG